MRNKLSLQALTKTIMGFVFICYYDYLRFVDFFLHNVSIYSNHCDTDQ